MPELKKCRACGVDIQSNAPFGHCPQCLLAMGFGPIPKEALEPTVDSPAQSATGHPPSIGTVRYFGDYELLEQIGRGGMGVVYKARQISLRRLVALKMISAGELASPTSVQRFHVEAEAAAKLDHPNIVPIYEIGIHQGQHYFSMKLVEGGSLQELMARERESSGETVTAIQQAVNLLAKIARAVHYAHQHGVLHRDLKPGNILLDAQGEPHITDFGLAKILEHEIGVTRTAEIIGTPSYMSPEQAAGHQLSTASDAWSLGVILYQLLTGQLPFCGTTPVETLRKVIEDDPVLPSKCELRSGRAERGLPLALRRSQVSPDLETICLKCLEKDPARRYASAQELTDELGRFLRDEPIRGRPTGQLEKAWRWCRRKPAVAGTLAAAFMLFLIIAIGAPMAAYRISYHIKRENQILSVTLESTIIVENYRQRILELNNLLLRYESSHQAEFWTDFVKKSVELNHYIDHYFSQQAPKSSVREVELLRQIDSAYDDYLRAATNLQVRSGTPPTPLTPSDALQAFASVKVETDKLLALAIELASAHRLASFPAQ
jgi:serine/threonine-protein kinase